MGRVTQGHVTRCALARISNGAVSAQLNFKYNPNIISRSRRPDWDLLTSPGTDEPIGVFNHVSGTKISFEVLLYAREDFDPDKKGLQAEMAFFELMTMHEPDTYLATPDLFVAPSSYRLVVGTRTWEVVCTSLDIKEEQWNSDMEPIRARVRIDLQTVFVDSSGVQSRLSSLEALRSLVEV